MTADGFCTYCDWMGDDTGLVSREDSWIAWSYPRHEVPGAVICATTRHVERLSDVNPGEAQAMGPFAARVAAAIERTLACEKVYMVSFLELRPHFHFVLLPRPSTVPNELRSARFITEQSRFIDPAAASGAASALRMVLSESAAGTREGTS